jgi:segregation and condensation protein A
VSRRIYEATLLPPSWQVQLPIFEGPLDLLLHLIKANEVEITDIPVARVCDQFHQYLELMEELNLDIAGEYIYVASQLIHLKSRMLLPRQKTVEGEEVAEDPREDLVRRLIEYQRLKEAAQGMAEVDRMRRGMWTRQVPPPKLEAPAEEEVDLGDLSLFDLLKVLKDVLHRYDKEHPPPLHLVRETFSVRLQFERLLANLDPGRPFDFIRDLRERSCRAEAISAFLALLEMCRLSLVRVHQTEGGEILLYRTTRDLQQAELESISA